MTDVQNLKARKKTSRVLATLLKITMSRPGCRRTSSIKPKVPKEETNMADEQRSSRAVAEGRRARERARAVEAWRGRALAALNADGKVCEWCGETGARPIFKDCESSEVQYLCEDCIDGAVTDTDDDETAVQV